MSLAPDAYARADDTPTADGGSIRHFPTFDLSYSFDDRYHPREVTAFEHGEHIATRWLTIDIGHAVNVEECR